MTTLLEMQRGLIKVPCTATSLLLSASLSPQQKQPEFRDKPECSLGTGCGSGRLLNPVPNECSSQLMFGITDGSP